jgi:adenine-specific DNA glycosylase
LLSFLEADTDTDLHQQALTLLKSVQAAPLIKPWQLPHLKHTFTHYQLNWTIWGIDLNLEQSVHLKLPEPWQYVVWREVTSKGVPAAVLKVLANQIDL